MKKTIPVPDPLFQAAEREAARRGISRSRFYSMAIAFFLKALRARKFKKALNAVYAGEDSALDPVLARLQREAVGQEEW